MAEFPSLPLFTDAYIADTRHLKTIEHGAYLLLLIICWRSKECSLEDDDEYLSMITGLKKAQWRKIRPKIEKFFTIENGFWTQKRLLKERNHVRKVVAKRKQAGLLGGRPKSLKDNDTPKAKGSDLLKQNESKPKAPTPTPKPIEEKSIKKCFDGVVPNAWINWALSAGLSKRDADIEKNNFIEYWTNERPKEKRVNWELSWKRWIRKHRNFGSEPTEVNDLLNHNETTIEDPVRADWLYAETKFKEKGALPQRFINRGLYDCPKDILDRNNSFEKLEAAE